MATLTPQFFQLLEAEQKMVFFKEHDQIPALYTQFYETMTSQKAYEDGIRVAGLGTFATKPEGTPIAVDDPVQGTQKRVTHTAFALGWRRSFEMMRDDQFNIMNRMAADLGDSARDHKERIAWDPINDAYVGARHTVLEGETIFSTTHTLLKTGGTQSNMLSPAVALSQPGIEAILTLQKTTLSMEGRYLNLGTGGILLIHPNEEHNAFVLLNTEFKPGSGDNDRSTVVSSRSGLTPLATPFQTSQTAWSVHARPGKNGFKWYDRDELDVTEAPDAHTKDRISYAYYRSSVACWTWENSFGSNA